MQCVLPTEVCIQADVYKKFAAALCYNIGVKFLLQADRFTVYVELAVGPYYALRMWIT